ncbi:MAG: hypothetical protein ACYTKD_07050 [Planctomycetota bacterium]|jgi:hypothetical protein
MRGNIVVCEGTLCSLEVEDPVNYPGIPMGWVSRAIVRSLIALCLYVACLPSALARDRRPEVSYGPQTNGSDAAKPPSVEEFEAADLSRKSIFIQKYRNGMLHLRRQQPTVTDLPDPWPDVLQAVLTSANQDPQLLQVAEQLFRCVPPARPEYATFYEGLLQSNAREARPYHTLAIEALSKCPHPSGKVRDLLLEEVAAGDSWGSIKALEALTEGFGSDDKVKKALLASLRAQDPSLQARAFRLVPRAQLDAEAARQALTDLLDVLSGPTNDQVRRISTSFAISMSKHPWNFVRILREPGVRRAAALLESDDKCMRHVAGLVLAIAPVRHAGAAENALWKLGFSTNIHEAHIAMAFGFQQPSGGTRTTVKLPDDLAKIASPEARAGIVSFCLRSGMNGTFVAPVLIGQETPAWLPHATYWAALLGMEVERPLPCERWKELWEQTPRGNRSWLVGSLAAYPSADDATWLIEEAMREPGVDAEEMLLYALLRARGQEKRLSTARGLKKWLEDLKDAPKRTVKYAAVSALAVLFSEPEPLLDEVQGADLAQLRLPDLAMIADALSRTVPGHVALERVEKAMFSRASEEARDAAKWIVGLRRGHDVGDVPVRSLGCLLSYPHADHYLSILASHGHRARAKLGEMRNVGLVFAVRRDSRPLMRYLGILDRLQLGVLRDDD